MEVDFISVLLRYDGGIDHLHHRLFACPDIITQIKLDYFHHIFTRKLTWSALYHLCNIPARYHQNNAVFYITLLLSFFISVKKIKITRDFPFSRKKKVNLQQITECIIEQTLVLPYCMQSEYVVTNYKKYNHIIYADLGERYSDPFSFYRLFYNLKKEA